MSDTQEKLEKLRSDAYSAARGDLDTDHPEGVHCLDIVWEQLMRLIDSAKREGYEQGYIECGMKWNKVAEEVLSSMKETREHIEQITAQLEQSEESEQ